MKDGETIKSYCHRCKCETTWIYVRKTLLGLALKCLGCGTTRDTQKPVWK